MEEKKLNTEKENNIENAIAHEFKVKNELIKRRESIKNFDELIEYIKDITEHDNCGYGEAPRAIAQASLAVAWYLSDVFGITGFQASCVMWDFITGWQMTGNTCGLKLVNYDDMLFPQYDHKFEKTITSDVWKNLQEQAGKFINDYSSIADSRVIEHWKSIVNGKVPFGYIVRDDI